MYRILFAVTAVVLFVLGLIVPGGWAPLPLSMSAMIAAGFLVDILAVYAALRILKPFAEPDSFWARYFLAQTDWFSLVRLLFEAQSIMNAMQKQARAVPGYQTGNSMRKLVRAAGSLREALAIIDRSQREEAAKKRREQETHDNLRRRARFAGVRAEYVEAHLQNGYTLPVEHAVLQAEEVQANNEIAARHGWGELLEIGRFRGTEAQVTEILREAKDLRNRATVLGMWDAVQRLLVIGDLPAAREAIERTEAETFGDQLASGLRANLKHLSGSLCPNEEGLVPE